MLQVLTDTLSGYTGNRVRQPIRNSIVRIFRVHSRETSASILPEWERCLPVGASYFSSAKGFQSRSGARFEERIQASMMVTREGMYL